MTNFTKEIINQVEKMNDRIDEKRKIISFSKLVDEKKFQKKCFALLATQQVLNGCIQCGNYRRVHRYLIFANQILKQIELYEPQIVRKLTDIIIQ